MEEKLIDFDIEKVAPSIIMVAGIGGAGGNAVNHMCDMGIQDVTFMVCNTDKQALDSSLASIKVQLGEGLGAGNNPQKGREAAIESLDEITNIFKNEGTKMVFVTAGMGGGTGTGAAPIIAKAAKDAGILTVAIVTTPYTSEGPLRVRNAQEGVKELRKHVDSLLVINNENIQEIYGELPLTEAFGRANDILATAAKGIAEIITRPGIVNVDFADVTAVMKDSGVSLMGSAVAGGNNRAIEATKLALVSPLLNHNSLQGARNVFLNVGYDSKEVTLTESRDILDHLQMEAGETANIIWGAVKNDGLGDNLEVIIIATGFMLDPDGRPMTRDGAMSRGRNLSHMGPPSNPFENFPSGMISGTIRDRVQGSSKTMKLEHHRRYDNIDKIYNTPAYLRKKIALDDTRTTAAANKPRPSETVRLKKESHEEKEEPRSQSSLFEPL